MKVRLIPLSVALGIGLTLHAQVREVSLPDRPPEQSFILRADLDPVRKVLTVDMTLDYTHTGSRPLTILPVHLWANAFSAPQTAFDRQIRQFGKTDLFFAPDKLRIRYEDLRFSRDDQPLSIVQPGTDPDIVNLVLDQPVMPGGSIRIRAEYRLHLPAFYSRLGTDGRIWQLAHWFPKPARRQGDHWLTIPYLELGEFIQDFADYKVILTVPDSFMVMSTGLPDDDQTRYWVHEGLERSSQGLPGLGAMPDGRRTWSFSADWVPDFALALSAAYLTERDTVNLPSGPVQINVAYTPDSRRAWSGALDMVGRAVRHYNRRVGAYPWPSATAIRAVNGFSGGMEYPMITYIQPGLVGRSLEEMIVHEVGHNWFYGVLSTDERHHPWMDEGMNSFYEGGYMRSQFPRNRIESAFDEGGILLHGEIGKRLQPIPANGIRDCMAESDYLTSAYTIPELMFRVVEAAYGREAVDHAFHAYYRKRAFTHPEPEEFRSDFTTVIGDSLNWLFQGALKHPFVRDLSLSGVSPEPGGGLALRIGQRGLTGAPFRISLTGRDTIRSYWLPGFVGQDTIIRIPEDRPFTSVEVGHDLIPELRTGNNAMSIRGWYRQRTGWKPGWIAGVLHAHGQRTYILPVAGYQVYDGFSPGVALHNQKVYYQPHGYFLGGMIGTRSGRVLYTGSLYSDWYPHEAPALVRLGLKARSATYFFLEPDLRPAYHRFEPYIEWQNRAEARIGETHWRAGAYAWFIRRQVLDFSGEIPALAAYPHWDHILALRTTVTRRDALRPWSIRAELEYQPYTDGYNHTQSYLKTGLEGRLSLAYATKRAVHLRTFIGGFPLNTRRDAGSVSNPSARGSLALAFQGINDYRYEEPFIGRSEQTGFSSSQILIRDGGFKTALGSAYPDGQSNNLIASVNVECDLPLRPLRFLRIYSDLGYWSDRTYLGRDKSFSDQVWWDLGIHWSILGDRIGMYLPLVQNKPLGDLVRQSHPQFLSRITWTVNPEIFRLPWDLPALF